MGVKLTELLQRKEIKLEDLSKRVIAIDASNHLYQFLTTIRAPDGALFTDSKGHVTSHLIGLFSRTSHLLQMSITPIYVFDGKPPALKGRTTEQRKEKKIETAERYEKATKEGDVEEMKKYAARTSRLTKDMVNDAKKLLEALGVPFLQAPSEGEAQAARIVKDDKAYAVASQDADSLLFGAEKLIRNLSITGRRQKGVSKEPVHPEMILLKELLKDHKINQKQLIVLAILVGTDYNPGGIKGIGPAKAMKLVKEFNDFDKLFDEVKWNGFFDFSWKEVYETITEMPTVSAGNLKLKKINTSDIKAFLCEEREFSTNRVESTLDKLSAHQSNLSQKGLHGFI